MASSPLALRTGVIICCLKPPAPWRERAWWGWGRGGGTVCFRNPLIYSSHPSVLPSCIGGWGREIAEREERKDSLKFGAAFCAHGLSSCDIQILSCETQASMNSLWDPVGFFHWPITWYEMSSQGLTHSYWYITVSASLSPAWSAAFEWILGRWLKLEQLFKCPPDPGQMMREPVFQSWPCFSLALFNKFFLCLNRHRVDQQACCLSRLIPGEWMKVGHFLREPPHFTDAYSDCFGF